MFYLVLLIEHIVLNMVYSFHPLFMSTVMFTHNLLTIFSNDTIVNILAKRLTQISQVEFL